MKSSVEATDPLHRTISIELPWSMVSEELDREYRELAGKVQIKGFRPGKVPKALLRQRFGERIHAQVAARLIQDAYEAALIQNRIQPVAAPELKRGEVREGQPYSFTAHVEVRPEIELKKLAGFDVSKEIEEVEVTEEMVAEELQRLRESRAILVPIEGRDEARMGDTAIVDYRAIRDGQLLEGGEKTDYEVELGAGKTIAGFEPAIVGMKVGERKDFDLTFPEAGFPAQVAGAQVSFEATLKALKLRELPDLDDEFAKDLGEEGVETVDDVRAMVRRRLGEAVETKAEREVKAKLIDQLLEVNPFPVPPSLVDRQKTAMLHELQTMLQFRGLTPDQIAANADKMSADIAVKAEREVAKTLLLAAIAEREKLEVTDADVQSHLESVAARSGESLTRLKALYNDPKLVVELKSTLIQEKVVDHLMKLSNMEEDGASAGEAGAVDAIEGEPSSGES